MHTHFVLLLFITMKYLRVGQKAQIFEYPAGVFPIKQRYSYFPIDGTKIINIIGRLGLNTGQES